MPLAEAKFAISKRVYAIVPDTYTFNLAKHDNSGKEYVTTKVQALWFKRRKNGLIAAFTGVLSDFTTIIPGEDFSSVEHIIKHYSSARYGATAQGCWDGKGTWWADPYLNSLEKQQEVLPTLQDMLKNYPDIPANAQGWYALKEKWD
jgi:hypothetical protein